MYSSEEKTQASWRCLQIKSWDHSSTGKHDCVIMNSLDAMLLRSFSLHQSELEPISTFPYKDVEHSAFAPVLYCTFRGLWGHTM